MEKVKIQGVKQNIYRRQCLALNECANVVQEKKFLSLEKTMLPNGQIFNLVEKDYPITPESVASYADAADYRNDPTQAIANAPQRINLGDISEAQKFIDGDPQRAIQQYKGILDKVNAYFEAQKVTEKPVVSNFSDDTKKEGE